MTQSQTDISKIKKLTKPVALVLAFGMLMSAIGNNFLITILPPLGREIGLIEWQIGAILGIGGALMMVTGPFWGRISETWGRKRVLLFGGIGYIMTTAMFAFVIDMRLLGSLTITACFILLLLARALYIITSGAIYPATVALVADSTSQENRASGIAVISASWGLGSVVGPAIAALFASLSATAPFYFITLVGVIIIPLYSIFIDEPRIQKINKKSSFKVLFTPTIISVSVGFTCLILGNIAMMVVLGFYFQDKFLLNTVQTAKYVGLALSASAITQIFVQIVVIPRLRWSPKKLINFGLPIAFVSVAFVYFSPTYLMVIGSMLLFGFGGGVGWPAYMTAGSLAAGPENQGNMAGLTSSFQALGFMLGPLIGTLAYQITPSLPFIICGVLLILSLLMVNFLPMPTPANRRIP